MAGGYETFEMNWSDRTISVRHQANWLSSGHWHVELRSEQILPISTTGYRSIFVPNCDFKNQADIEAFLVLLLEEAASSKAWLKQLEDERQPRLL